ncbi:hypothetical protein TNCV_3503311 [Trichonephila clavipes]|uniref:Uncharacterized protein n=1 Tax=Trichonephila clavipes TaxID=2585209 RepID=A0A8X6VDT6_TRICX|nr:hypothetical protein TNCV_3503311 [Trichonephila clavipes]
MYRAGKSEVKARWRASRQSERQHLTEILTKAEWKAAKLEKRIFPRSSPLLPVHTLPPPPVPSSSPLPQNTSDVSRRKIGIDFSLQDPLLTIG